MSTIRILGLTILSILYVAPSFGRTEATKVEKDMYAIRASMRQYQKQFGVLPVGENRSVIVCLMKSDLSVPNDYLSAEGALLDPWKNPYYSLPCRNGDAVILSLGELVDGKYSKPIAELVEKVPLQTRTAQASEQPNHCLLWDVRNADGTHLQLSGQSALTPLTSSQTQTESQRGR